MKGLDGYDDNESMLSKKLMQGARAMHQLQLQEGFTPRIPDPYRDAIGGSIWIKENEMKENGNSKEKELTKEKA